MWDVFKDKFIGNDTQYYTVLVIMGEVLYEYAPLEVRELYDSLTTEEINYIRKRLERKEK